MIEKKIPGIEFFTPDDKEGFINIESLRVGKPLTYLEALASKFKSEVIYTVNKYKIKFMFNESNKAFKPFRMYYATAIRELLLEDNPNNAPEFIKLKEFNRGLEAAYYFEIHLKEIIHDLHELFFVDSNNTFYLMQEDMPITLTGITGKYGYTNLLHEMMKVTGEENNFDITVTDIAEKVLKEKDTVQQMPDMFKKTWVDEYEEKIPAVYNWFMQDYLERDRESVSRMKAIMVDFEN